MSHGLTFKTKSFNEDAEFTGPVALKLWVRLPPLAWIFAALHLIDPGGQEITFTGNTDPHVPWSAGSLESPKSG